MKQEISPYNMVQSGLCIGCGSCVAQASDPSINIQFNKQGELNPKGPAEWYHSPSTRLAQTCPFSPYAADETQLASTLFPDTNQKQPFLGWLQSAYVGYAAEGSYRLQGSSGGMVSWVATELMRQGLIDGVAHVIATEAPQQEGRYFRYRISRTTEEIQAGAKSRYYPVDLSEVLQMIRNVPGRYAVVGIPCFIKAIQLLRKEDPVFRERIAFTLGLFCGHMKSARFVESFAWQMQVPVTEIQKVEFRYKDSNRPANLYTAMLTLRDGRVVSKDWWHLADGDWGAGFFMNHACNFCDDVVAETADISFGDAWVEPYSSDGKGTNVVVVRNPKVDQLLKAAIQENRLCLQQVDHAFVEQTQAAGFRQRREGLAYRLTWNKAGIQPRKRVAPDDQSQTSDRKRIYRMRYLISKWSHRMFEWAARLRMPKLYIKWAAMSNAAYYSLAYYKGSIKEFRKRLKGF